MWLHKPSSVGKQAKKLGLFFLETGPASGHVQNIPVATLHPGKSRNGDPVPKSWNPTIFFRNYKEWGCQGIPLLALSFIYRFAIVTLPAGQDSMLQSKLGCGKVVLILITFPPKPVVVWNIILWSKQMPPHWLLFLYTCWTSELVLCQVFAILMPSVELDSSSPFSSVWLLCYIGNVESTVLESQIPLLEHH